MTDYYDCNATSLSATYESLDASRLHAWLLDSLPARPGCVLDVGAGSGRDAAWLASLGHDVVAVEPSGGMVREAQRRHVDPSIHWIQGDRLPGLERTLRLGKAFDFILLSAVWMHVAPDDRPRAFRKLMSLMKPGGCMALTLRHGPAAAGQLIYESSAGEMETLCRAHGAYIQAIHDDVPDLHGRADVTWTQLLIRLPDDGTGALPLLRHIILNESKSSTYKPALLRTLCRIADGAAGMARTHDGDTVALPLGLVALFWLRLYKPLIAAGLPQAPTHQGLSGLGFVKEGYRAILDLSPLELHPGRRFDRTTFAALHTALKQVADVIQKMPARHITHSDGRRVFPVQRPGRARMPEGCQLDEPYLYSFGEFRVPSHLWLALQRYAVWVEPAIETEWIRQMGVAAGSQQAIDQRVVAAAMRWIDPERDQRIARERALEVMQNTPLKCVWSDRPLTPKTMEIDHCLPWAVWPCSDLWNLLPAHRDVNRSKRQQVPSSALLRARAAPIREWWMMGYCSEDRPAIHEQFETEARSTLPYLSATCVTADEVFSGLLLQQLRLRHDQQSVVWEGV